MTGALFLLPKIKKEEKNMAEKNVNLEKMRKEVEELKVKKEQDEHELIRRNNQIAKLTKKERSRRTSRLCSNAGYLESIFPVIKDAPKTDFIQLYWSRFLVTLWSENNYFDLASIGVKYPLAECGLT